MLGTRGAVLVIAAALALLAPSAASAATINVTTLGDDLGGATPGCSLREAIQSVNTAGPFENCANSVPAEAFGTNDTINLPTGNYALQIDGADEDANATGDLDILSDVSIVGAPVPNEPTISEGFAGDDRVLNVPNANASLSLSSLDVNGGDATSNTGDGNRGGNILFEGASPEQLSLTGVEVTSGTANAGGGGVGGGIASTAGGAVSLQNGAIAGNQAGDALGSAGVGGGIDVRGPGASLTVNGTNVIDNDAADGGGAGTLGIGGGISFAANSVGTSSMQLTNASVNNNQAAGGTSEGSGSGGGISVIGNGDHTLTVTGGSISNNIAGGEGGALANEGVNQDGLGGGLHFDVGDASAEAQLTNVTVSDNQAGGRGGRGDGQGGGIYTQNDLTVTGGQINANFAGVDNPAGGLQGAPGLTGGGGGIRSGGTLGADLAVSGTTFNGNWAGENSSQGGAITMQASGNLSVSGATITNNSAGNNAAGGLGTGGGIHRHGNDEAIVDTVSDTTISGNKTRGIGGAAPTEIANGGAGLFAQSRGSMTIERVSVSGNQAQAALSAGGGISLDSVLADPGAFQLINSTINGNTVSGGGSRGGGVGVGGRFGDVTPPTVAITHSTIAGNSAGTGAGGNLGVINTVTGALTDLRATIIADGTATASNNCSMETPDDIESLGENIETSAATQCNLSAGLGDQIGVNALLGPLAVTPPGTTATMALQPGSPAIDSVPLAGCPATDQRGVSRAQPQGPACDAGAFEVETPAPATGGGGGGTTTPVVTPPPTKKCKKGFKLKKGKCKRKKRKKKK
jgi:CSLREA domain-containing protein